MFIAYAQDKIFKDIGTSRQLFIDDDVVASVKNVTRRQHTPRKHPDNPLIKRDKPWEVTTYFRISCFNVIRDQADGLFKCWYQDFIDYFGSTQKKYQRTRVFYAQSADGLSWEKPALGKHNIDGHDTNAVLYSPDENFKCPSVLLDERETDSARRYKMMYFHNVRGRPGSEMCLAFSPNGIDWTPYEGNPIFPLWMGDVEILTYDPIDKKYLMFGRYGGRPGSSHPDYDEWFAPVWPSRPEGIWGTRRRIYRTESEDCLNWSEPELIFDPGEEDNLDDGLYGFTSWRADEMYLGILNVLHAVDNTLDMYLLNSRDGLSWKRLQEHRPLIPRGGEGSYDQLDIETPSQPLVVGDEVWFYYGGNKVHHDWWMYGKEEGLDVPEAHDPSLSQDGHHLCLATLRLDGYVSLGATVREGYVETKPVASAAPHLFINGRCDQNGYIKVEMMDSWNNVWEGYSQEDCQTFTGDSIHHHVQWADRDTVNEIPDIGRGVKLRFYLRNAELYGFQFADS